jgi:FlaA1/EpsC-like NDP-sugar epimerase
LTKKDIDVQFTGIRPGEKLFEELARDDERTRPTAHAKIRIWELALATDAQVGHMLTTLSHVTNAPASEIKGALHQVLSTEQAAPALRLVRTAA